ncbi:c-type cytochrome domain-containing protein [Roseimaritima ulvae]|nr:c-type cytochrome domain-containing protein [Roseimaritima ulvae]
MNVLTRILCTSIVGWLAVAVPAADAADAAKKFAEVPQLLRRNCIACHHAKEAEGGLDLETRQAMLRGGDSGPAIQPGEAKASLLWQRISGAEDPIMPPEDNEMGAHPLTPDEQDLIARWIDAGAPLTASPSTAPLDWQPLPENLRPIYATASSATTPLAAYGLGQQVWLRYFDGQGQTLGSYPLSDPKLPSPTLTSAEASAQPGSATAASAEPFSALDIVSSLAISRDGQMIAVGGFRKLDLWRFDGSPQPPAAPTASDHSGAATHISPSGRHIAYAQPGSDKLIVYNADRSDSTALTLPVAEDVQQVLWSADEDRLSVALQDGTLVEFAAGVPDPEAVSTLGTGRHPWVWLDEHRLAGLNDQHQLEVWRTADDAAAPWVRDETFTPLNDIQQVTPIVHDRAVMVALLAQRWLVLLAADGSEVGRLDHGGKVSGFALQGNGKRLVSLGPQGLPKIWDVDQAAVQGELNWYQPVLDAVDFAQRDVNRQQAKLNRLKPRLAPLQATVKTQSEAVARALEEHNKAVADVAAKQAALDKLEQPEEKPEEQPEAVKKAAAALSSSQQALAKREQILATTRDAQASAEAAVAALVAMTESESQFLASLQKTLDAALARRDEPLAATTHVTFSPDGRFVVVGTAAKELHVFSAEGLQRCVTLHSDRAVERISITAAGRILEHRPQGGQPHSWPLLGRWRQALTLGGGDTSLFADRVTAIDIDSPAQRIAAGSGLPSRDGTLTIFQAADGQLEHRFEGLHSDSIMGVAFAPDGRSVASVAADKLVRVSVLDADRPPLTLEGHGHHVLAVAWHADGHRLVTGAADKTMRVWDTESARSLRSIGGFSDEVTSVRMVSDSNQVAVSAGRTVPQLIDINNGSKVRNFAGARDYVYSLSILSGNQLLLAGDHSGNLTLWKLASGTEVK